MKKLLAFLLAACISLFLAVPAFADGRGPAFTNYDVICTKDTPYYQENWDKDGVMEKKGSFPSGTVLTVEYEYEKDGVLYGNVNIGNDEDWEWAYIRIDDVNLKDDTYLPENAQKLSRPHTVRIIAHGGIPMYAGPNKKYSTIFTIPRGTKLTYLYGNDEETYYRTWAYVTYLNKSGWIYVYAYDADNGLVELPDADEKAEIWAISGDVKMYSGFSFGNIEDEINEDRIDTKRKEELHREPDRVIGTLENGKKYTYQYKHAQDYGTWYYVTAGLRRGWVYLSEDTSRIAAETTADYRDKFMTYMPLKLKLHEAPNEKASAVTVTVPKDTVLRPDYYAYNDGETYFYITLGETSGWYSAENAWQSSAYKVDATDDGRPDYWDKNYSEKAAPIYSDILKRDKTVGTIPANSRFTQLYSGGHTIEKPDEEETEWFGFCYVEYNGVKGWVLDNDLNAPYEDEEETTEEEEEYSDYDEWEEDWEEDDWTEDEEYEEDDVVEYVEPVQPRNSLSAVQIVLICVGGAVVLALTAAVTLILIRRKRGAKPSAEPEETESEASGQTESAVEEAPDEDAPPTDEA